MYCNHCGMQLGPNASYCPRCGVPAGTATDETLVAGYQDTMPYQPTPAGFRGYVQPTAAYAAAGVQGSAKTSNAPKVAVGILGALAAALACTAIVLAIGPFGSNNADAAQDTGASNTPVVQTDNSSSAASSKSAKASDKSKSGAQNSSTPTSSGTVSPAVSSSVSGNTSDSIDNSPSEVEQPAQAPAQPAQTPSQPTEPTGQQGGAIGCPAAPPAYPGLPCGSEPAPAQEEPAPTYCNDYVLPDSNTRYYSRGELQGLDLYTLYLARNEVYARHGRLFQREDLQRYFNSKSWYHGYIAPEDFSDDMLSDVERANVYLMLDIERSRGSQYL